MEYAANNIAFDDVHMLLLTWPWGWCSCVCEHSIIHEKLHNCPGCLNRMGEEDDGSSDNTVEIIESSKLVLKKNFKLIINEKNMGKGGAVFRGLKESSGEYRVFADCDLAYPSSEIKKVAVPNPPDDIKAKGEKISHLLASFFAS